MSSSQKAYKVRKHKEKSCLIIPQEGLVCILKEMDHEIKYGFIGGFLKKEESPEEAIIRAIRETTDIRLFEENLEYHTSVTIDIKDNLRLTKHYFVYKNTTASFLIDDIDQAMKFEKIPWEETLKYLEKSDKKIIKELFEPCILND